MPKYNHAFDIGFAIENDSPTGETTIDELLEAIKKKVDYLSSHRDEVKSSCDLFDTYEID